MATWHEKPTSGPDAPQWEPVGDIKGPPGPPGPQGPIGTEPDLPDLATMFENSIG